MEAFLRHRSRTLLGAVTLFIACATTGLFLTFSPPQARATYWLALADVVLMEAVIGVVHALEFTSATGLRATGPLTATRISARFITLLMSGVGVLADATFLFALNSTNWDRLFVWCVIGRWTILALLLLPIFLVDAAGRESRPTLVERQQERLALLSIVEEGLRILRDLNCDAAERSTMHALADEVETVRNRLKGWVSASNGETPSKMLTLVQSFTIALRALRVALADERTEAAIRLRAATREVAQELTDAVVATRPEAPPDAVSQRDDSRWLPDSNR